MKGTLITSTRRSAIHLLAVQGIPAPECHTQIVDIVRNRLGEAHVLLFAEPVFDVERGVVDWYTPVQGTPARLVDLAPELQQRIRSRFVAMAEDIRSCVKPLKATGDNRRGLAGDILELSLLYPNEEALYLVGEQPVVTCWGCGPAQAGVEPQDLSRLAPQRLSRESHAPPAAVQPPAPPPQPVAQRGSLLPWLLALLLLLAIAGLGYMIHAGKMPDLLARMGFMPKTPEPMVQKEDLTTEQNRLEELSAEIETLRLQLVERRSQCLPEAPPETPPETLPEALPEALNVPPQAPQTGDLSFLEGDWICDAGLADSNNRPVIVVYSFKRDGTGSISIRGESGECTAAASTSIDRDGILNIQTDHEISCPGGAAYRGQAVTCMGVGGQTRCEGRNTPGTTTWEASFYRK